jgi:hypothetical protein
VEGKEGGGEEEDLPPQEYQWSWKAKTLAKFGRLDFLSPGQTPASSGSSLRSPAFLP